MDGAPIIAVAQNVTYVSRGRLYSKSASPYLSDLVRTVCAEHRICPDGECPSNRRFGFQRGVTVASRSQFGFPA